AEIDDVVTLASELRLQRVHRRERVWRHGADPTELTHWHRSAPTSPCPDSDCAAPRACSGPVALDGTRPRGSPHSSSGTRAGRSGGTGGPRRPAPTPPRSACADGD